MSSPVQHRNRAHVGCDHRTFLGWNHGVVAADHGDSAAARVPAAAASLSRRHLLVGDGNLLTAAVATPIVSRLADMYGKRLMMLVCIVLMTAGSLVAALSAGSFIALVVGRSLQGFAAALIPVGISIMRDELPKNKVGSAIALMSATLGLAAPSACRWAASSSTGSAGSRSFGCPLASESPSVSLYCSSCPSQR